MQNQDAGEVLITCEGDLVTCRKKIRTVATKAGFAITDVTRIVTAVSELARNVYVHAGSEGSMKWRLLSRPGNMVGIELTFEDDGVGISDVDQALEAGFSTANTMGMGLSGVKRLMDEMELHSEVGTGTQVKVVKWGRKK